MADSLTVITRSRIFDIVLSKSMMLREGGESEEALPGLSRTTPLVFFTQGGW